MWFNRGSGGSSARLNRLPHGFTPASLRCLCTMDPESLGKALQDCLRALGTGQGADPPAAPAPQAAAAPPAPHLADKFPLKEEVVVHNTCNPDTTLAPETPEWRWLADVTPKYVQTRRDPELVRRVNAHIRSVLPQLTYTALAVVHGVGDHPMLVHTHPQDDSPLTGEIALGDFVGGGLFTSALLCANGPSRPAWIRWGRDLLWGHIVDPRYGVMFNALRPHVPLA